MSIFLRLMDSELLILIENGWGWEQVSLKIEKENKWGTKSIKMLQKSIDGKVCCSFVLTI